MLEGTWYGTLPYGQAMEIQRALHRQVAAGERPHHVMLLEHTPVITAGRRGGEEDLLASPSELKARGVDFVRTDRGGLLTFHGPGQLVAYPILNLTQLRLSLTDYITRLLTASADCLKALGLPEVQWNMDQPGIYTPNGKIGSVGVRLTAGATLHGVALNLTTDPTWFNLLNSCGQATLITTLQAETNTRTTPEQATPTFLKALTSELS